MSGIARLSLAEIKEVLAELDGPGTVLNTMAAMQNVLVGKQSGAAEAHMDESREILDRIIADRGWHVRPDSPAYHCAVQTIAELHTTNLAWTPEMLGEYAEHAAAVSGLDVQTLDFAGTPDNLLVQIVQGTLLRRQLVDSLVLLGQQHIAHQRFTAPAEAVSESVSEAAADN